MKTQKFQALHESPSGERKRRESEEATKQSEGFVADDVGEGNNIELMGRDSKH